MLNIRPLSKELQQKAIDELNEDVSRIPDDIQAIREWLQQQKYITARTDDQFILTFLRGCKFSLERTKDKIKSYYTMRTLIPEFSRNRNPFLPEIQDTLKLGLYLPIFNGTDPTSPTNIILNVAAYDAAKVRKEDIAKVAIMIAEILVQEDDRFAICGVHLMIELSGLKMAQIWPPALMMKCLKFLQESLPCRAKGIHMLNMPGICETAFAIMKTFLSEKLKRRVQLHTKSNYENMYKTIRKEDLPKEYGGDGHSLQELTDFWKKKVESYAGWFKEDEKYVTNEKLRPGMPKTSQELFGIEGSFRSLNVD